MIQDEGWTMVKSKKSKQCILKETIIAQRKAIIAMRAQMVQMNILKNKVAATDDTPTTVGKLAERSPQLDRLGRRPRGRRDDRRRRASALRIRKVQFKY